MCESKITCGLICEAGRSETARPKKESTMTPFERKLRTLVSYGLYFFGCLVLVWETFVYNLTNPHLTQMQVTVEKWPWILAGVIALIIAFRVHPDPAPAEQPPTEESEPGVENG